MQGPLVNASQKRVFVVGCELFTEGRWNGDAPLPIHRVLKPS